MAHKAMTLDPALAGDPADLVQRAIAILAEATANSQPAALADAAKLFAADQPMTQPALPESSTMAKTSSLERLLLRGTPR